MCVSDFGGASNAAPSNDLSLGYVITVVELTLVQAYEY